MRIVRRVGKRLDADSARDIGERALAALATDQDTATLEILDRTLFGLVGGVEIILVTLHAIKQKRNPAAAALHETDPELGEAVEDTVIDQCHQRNHQRHRMVQDMGRGEVGKRFEPDAAVGAAMDGQRAAEPGRLGVNRPVILVPEMERQSGRRDHGARQAEVADCALELGGGRLGILHGDQRHRPQPVAHPCVHVVDIVVIGTADGGGVARVLDVADRQPLGGEQHRSVELRLVEKRKPVGGRFRPVVAGRHTLAHRRTGMQGEVKAVERWKHAFPVARWLERVLSSRRVHEFGELVNRLDDMAVAVDDVVLIIRHLGPPLATAQFRPDGSVLYAARPACRARTPGPWHPRRRTSNVAATSRRQGSEGMAYDSLRPYLQVLEQNGMMRWVDKEVDKDWEISSVLRMIFRAMPEDKRYGIGFRNIKGFPGGRMVAGVIAASREMLSVAVGCVPTLEAIHTRVIDGMENPIPPVIVDDGPCKEVIIRGADVDLGALPIPIWTSDKDAGPYLTPLWVTKDPDTGRRNIGIRRCQIKGRDTTGILFASPDRGGAIHYEKWKRLGKNMPAAIYIGADPVQYLVAPSRYGPDELAVAGGIRGEAIPLVKCETVDLEVPATAEIVIEGEILIDGLEKEGPFGEFTGYMAGGRECPVFKATCITHRKDPIMLGIISQFPPSESSMIKRALLEAGIKKHLRDTLNIPGITNVHALEAGGCTATLWISLDKMYPGQVDQTAFGAWSYQGMSYYKWIIVTDDDIDIEDPFMRDWVMAWRVRPDVDMRVIAGTAPVELDPSALGPDYVPGSEPAAKVLIDATRKWDYPGISLPPIDRLRSVAENWDDYGLPPLDELKLPREG